MGVAASGAQLQLVAVVNGHDVVVEAPLGQMVLFQAWLPHLTRNAVEGPPGAPGDWRLHHTAYARCAAAGPRTMVFAAFTERPAPPAVGTEYFGNVVRSYRVANKEMCVENIGATEK